MRTLKLIRYNQNAEEVATAEIDLNCNTDFKAIVTADELAQVLNMWKVRDTSVIVGFHYSNEDLCLEIH